MKVGTRFLIAAICCLLLAVVWLRFISVKSDEEEQSLLIEEASELLEQKIYIRAVPILNDALQYDASRSQEAEELLKTAYLALISETKYRSAYEDLLETQMQRDTAPASVFQEAFEYYLERGEYTVAISCLRTGTQTTGDAELQQIYEQYRYMYSQEQLPFDAVTDFLNGAIQVELSDQWGLADQSGNVAVSCQYDKISTFCNAEAFVKKGNEIYAIDEDEHRLYVSSAIRDFSNLSENRIGILTDDGWILASGSLETGSTVYEAIGTFQEGFAPAKQNGKWGVITTSGEWHIEPEFDEIAVDELGRCGAGSLVFGKKDGVYRLYVNGKAGEEEYEDAQPFFDGYAAVKKNGKWGYVNTEGEQVIPFQYAEALAFHEGLAAVSNGDQWGYITAEALYAIEPSFANAKSFSNHKAIVLEDSEWSIISLYEYE